jgi:hypothetical protein
MYLFNQQENIFNNYIKYLVGLSRDSNPKGFGTLHSHLVGLTGWELGV